MEKRIAKGEDPRSFGKPPRHSKFGLWRYRLRDYRIICQLQQSKLVVLVVAIGHRSIVYDDGVHSALLSRNGGACLH